MFLPALIAIVVVILVAKILTNLIKLPNKKVKPQTKKCPFCAEQIKYEAVVCKHCGRSV